MFANGSLAWLTLAYLALVLLLFIFITAVGIHFWYWQRRAALKQDRNEHLARRALAALGILSLAAVPVVAWLMRVVAGVPLVLVVVVGLVLLLLGVSLLAISRHGDHDQVLRWLDTLIPTPQATVERWQRHQANLGSGNAVPLPAQEDGFAWPEFSLVDRLTALLILLIFFTIASLISLGLLTPNALIIALGAALVLHGGVQLAQVRGARRWRPVPAVITRSEMKSVAMRHRGTPTARFLPVIEYQYRVDDRTHSGQRISLLGDEYLTAEPQAVERLLNRYPVRATPMVYHHPRHPERAVLRPEADAGTRRRYGWYLIGGLLLIFLGLGLELMVPAAG